MIIVAKPAFRARRSSVSSCVCLYQNIRKQGEEVLEWTPHRMLFGHYDILHLHWPDNVLSEKSVILSSVKMFILFSSMLIVRMRGRRIVWTSHNLHSHEQRHLNLEKLYWMIFPRLLDAISCPMDWIAEAVRSDHRFLGVKHIEALPFGSWAGMYIENIGYTENLRARLSITPKTEVALWFGLVRRYKGIEALIELFSQTPLSERVLVIAGYCSDADYLEELKSKIVGKSNIRTNFGFVEDGHVASYFQLATICIFPFSAVTNSGSARLALTFNRHILVPDFPFAKEFRMALGERWVSCYPHAEGLSLKAVLEAFRVGRKTDGATIDWGIYNWEATALKTIKLYKKIV